MNEKSMNEHLDKIDRDTQLKKFYKSEFELYEQSRQLLNENPDEPALLSAYQNLLKAYYKNLKMTLKITNIGDSTQNKLLKAQEILRNQEEKLRAIFDNAMSGIITIDLMAHLISFNSNWQLMIENDEDIHFKAFYDFLYEEDRPVFFTHFNYLIHKETRNFRLQLRLIKKDTCFWADCSASVIHDKDGNPESIIIIMADIDEQIKTQEKLVKSYQQIKDAQEEILKLERQTTALAMAVTANHEINQPLMVMRANLDMLVMMLPEEVQNEKIKRYIQRVDESVERIKDILDQFKKSQKIEFEDYGGNTTMVSFNSNSEFSEGLDDIFDDAFDDL